MPSQQVCQASYLRQISSFKRVRFRPNVTSAWARTSSPACPRQWQAIRLVPDLTLADDPSCLQRHQTRFGLAFSPLSSLRSRLHSSVFVCRLSLLLWAKRRAIQIRLHPSVLYGPSGRPPFVEARFPCPFSGSTIQRWIIRPAASEFLRRASQFWRYRHVVLSGSQTIDPNQWPADQRGLFERFIDHSRRLHVCRLSLMVALLGWYWPRPPIGSGSEAPVTACGARTDGDPD